MNGRSGSSYSKTVLVKGEFPHNNTKQPEGELKEQIQTGLIFGDPNPWHTMDWISLGIQLGPDLLFSPSTSRVTHHAQSHRH